MAKSDAFLDKSDRFRVVGDIVSLDSDQVFVSVAGRFRSGPSFQLESRVLEQEYVLIYTEEGRGIVRVRNRREVAIPHTVCLLFPGAEHGYGTLGPSWGLRWAHFSGTLPPLLENAFRAHRWIPPTPLQPDSKLPELLNLIMEELVEKRPYFDSVASSYLTAALFEFARCGPAAGPERMPKEMQILREVLAYLQENMMHSVKVEELASLVHVSSRHLGRIFESAVGQSPKDYILRIKLAEAKRLLMNPDLTLADIATRVGFADPDYFSRLFKRKVGCTPGAFRMRGL